jgi:uncharacterized protein YdeI (YjbR/CyaY-like superfamily)
MSRFNPAVDEYIAKSAEFARPILSYLRNIIHETCPEVEEVVKWGYPHFDYQGDVLCIIGSFKNHISFSIYKAELMIDPKLIESVKAGKKMGYMDKVKAMDELPARDVLETYIKDGMVLNEKGIKKTRPVSDKPKVIEVPDYFQEQLNANPEAKKVFESKSDSFRKEYLVWITDAKSEATRQKRIDQSLEWIAEGKGRFWQYAK